MKNYIFDCVTFFRENFITNLRFEILNNVVDFFIVCESAYDHRGKKKKINFRLLSKRFKNKVIHLVIKEKFEDLNPWKNQAAQREYIFKGLSLAKENDYVMFSDPDEIPNPNLLKNFKLDKKFGIFMQKSYCYKINIFNQHETPWEGTRVIKKKNLHSIDYLRQKIFSKNLKYSFFRFDKEKDIELFNNGGWHFNNLFSPKEISIKLKTFAHSEFSDKKYSSIKIIKGNILERRDLFHRGRIYKKVFLDSSYPKYILDNTKKLSQFIDK